MRKSVLDVARGFTSTLRESGRLEMSVFITGDELSRNESVVASSLDILVVIVTLPQGVVR
jgi:hypothetical protein